MILPEDEARGKWCPYRAIAGRTLTGSQTVNCLGSGCMFWQQHGMFEEEVWKAGFPTLADASDHAKSVGFRLRASNRQEERGGVMMRLFYRKTDRPQGACGAAERDVIVEL